MTTADPFAKWQQEEEISQPEQNQASDQFAKWTKNEDEKLHYGNITQRQWDAMSEDEREEAVTFPGFSKSLLSGLSLGLTEKFPTLKPKDEEDRSTVGQFLGAALPISAAAKLISYPIKAISGLMNFGKAAKFGMELAGAGLTGAAYSTGKQAIKGEGIDPEEALVEGAEFAAVHAGLSAIFKAVPGARDWLNSLRTGQRAKLMVEGAIPENMTTNQYKFYAEEIVPKIQENAKIKYEQGLQKAIQENDANYKMKLNETKTNHENELYKRSQKEQLSAEEYEQAQRDYQNKLRNVAAEHEAKSLEIQKQNEIAMKEFEQNQKDFDKMKRREQIVKDAIEPKEVQETDLTGRVTRDATDVSIRPTPAPEPETSIKNKVGEVISPNSIESTAPRNRGNTNTAGQQLIEGVRANDAVDYAEVNEAYRTSDQLNEQVSTIHPPLVQELEDQAATIRRIPKPSPPQEQQLSVIEEVLDEIRTVDESGNITGFKPINNRVLQEQAKALRYFMDFRFEHGNTRGLFGKTTKALEDAVEFGANSTGNEAAAEASSNARRLYRQWAEDYDNPYIRPLRDRANTDYSKTFKSTSNIDEYNAVNNILSRSNAGQQISGVARRELVQNHLKKFMDNPRTMNQAEFNETLREIGAVITPEEEFAIREQFAAARRTPVVKGKKQKKPELKEPKLKKEDTSVKIPTFTGKKKFVPPISEVKIPLKPEVKPTSAMKNAAQMMEITPEELIRKGDDVSGLKEIKESLAGQPKLIKKVYSDKLRQIFYEGNIEPNYGADFYKMANKGNNYALMEEILGEEAAADFLAGAKEIGKSKVTVERLKKVGVKIGTIKTLLLFGIL